MNPMILSDRKVFQMFEGCLLHYKKHAGQLAAYARTSMLPRLRNVDDFICQ